MITHNRITQKHTWVFWGLGSKSATAEAASEPILGVILMSLCLEMTCCKCTNQKNIAWSYTVLHETSERIDRNIKQGSMLDYAIIARFKTFVYRNVKSRSHRLTAVCPWWADVACFSVCGSGLLGSSCTIVPRGARTHWQSQPCTST